MSLNAACVRRVAPLPFTLALAAAAAGVVAGPAGGLGTRTARASVVLAMDLPELVQRADHIAVVDVVSLRSDWDAKHERIFSTIDLKVVERWKGAAATSDGQADHITLVEPGGTVGDLTMTVTGMSTFKPGERALVFAAGAVTHAQIVGMAQGKRALRFEASSGRWLVHPPNLRQATLVKPPATSSAAPTSKALRPNDVRVTALDELRSQVQALVGAATR